MNLEFTEEQVALRDLVRRFLSEKASITEHVRTMLDHPTGTTQPLWQGLADLDVTGLLVPQDYGGAGATMVEAGIVLEEMGRALDPGPWQSTAVAATRTLARLNATEHAADVLTGIADGSVTATVCLPHAQDVVATALGTDSLVTGTFTAVPDAAAANVLLVPVPTATRISLFVVEIPSAGLEITPQPTVDRTRKQFRVTLVNTPARHLGTAPTAGLAAVIDDVLIASAADALGAAQRILELSVDHARTRQQFGRPIGAFQAVQHLCVDMFETVELARGGVLRALWAADFASDEHRHLAAIRTKAFAGRLATVGEAAIQIFGGIGFTWEHDAHLYLERLLSWSAFLGGPDRYLREIGSHVARGRQRTATPRSTVSRA
ncbi:acyl-CoA dehydrogenase family protein [Nocardia vinacea]|uniref:acyl-CoA dehydrogenase family protein n=1 Tax=Nocardia vinacea TaxID=96468 RepID=UPI0003195722|nr:acyl-CoA dehydrogenase family protein [Nocardia vinacea]